MGRYSIRSLIWPSLVLVLSFCYVFDVPARNILHGPFLESYSTCLRSAYQHASDLGQHNSTNVPHMNGGKGVEHAQAGTTKTCQADGTITSCRLALLDLIDVPPAISAQKPAVPGAVNRGGGGPGGCSSTDTFGTCLLTATNIVEQKPPSGAVIRDGTGPGGCSPTDAPGTCSLQAFINMKEHYASDHSKSTIVPQLAAGA